MKVDVYISYKLSINEFHMDWLAIKKVCCELSKRKSVTNKRHHLVD